MEFVRSELSEGVLEITMSRGKANALNIPMVEELLEALDRARQDDVRGILLTSDRPGFFCVGFDVREVFGYEPDQMQTFWGRFGELTDDLYSLGKPVVAALNGHTFAGGIILAFACDVRIVANGPYGAAMSGINLGIPLPYTAMRMAIASMGVAHARHLFLTGETINPQRMVEIGFARELAEEDKVLEVARTHARTMASKSTAAYAAIKAMYDDMVPTPDPTVEAASQKAFHEFWFSDESVARKQAIVDSLDAKSA